MADNTDKALPNEPRKTITLPGEEEIKETIVEAQETAQESPDGVETVENEDGSVDINFDPNTLYVSSKSSLFLQSKTAIELFEDTSA